MSLLSQGSRVKTPKDYDFAVLSHSAREMHASLYPGVNYKSFAWFLTGPRSSGVSIGSQEPYDYIVIHDLNYCHGDARRITRFSDDDTGMQGLTDHPFPETTSGHLVFLRGFPSPNWVRTVGLRYGVDPEYFRRLLSFGRSRDYYDLPALPSSSSNIINIRITSIGQHPNIAMKRQQAPEQTLKHFQSLGIGSRVGESIVRELSVHDGEHFSIEQEISICVNTKKGHGWNGKSHVYFNYGVFLTKVKKALIFLDVGRDLDDGPPGPWSNISSYPSGNIFLPVIQSEPRICLRDHHKWNIVPDPPLKPGKSRSLFMQSASILSHDSYGRFLKDEVMKLDAFYALSDLYSFAASAENEFFNLLRAKLDSETKHLDDERHMETSLQNLVYHRKLLGAHAERLQEAIWQLGRHGSPDWPTHQLTKEQGKTRPSGSDLEVPNIAANQVKSATTEVEQAVMRLIDDYEHLLNRAKSLSIQYKEGMEHIQNSAMLYESRKAIEQARGVARLTLLAFFFIPLGFTTSFFGMNFQELGDHLSIWIWFATSVPIFALSLIVCFWSTVSLLFTKR